MSKELITLDDDKLEQIEQLSGHNYSPEKIALYLDVDKELFMKLWYDKQSKVRYAFDKGQLVSEFNVMNKQKQLAESGNITAAQIFLKEKETQKIENIRNHVLFGE